MSSFTIQPDMVSWVKIKLLPCYAMTPCVHPVTVWLKDGRVSNPGCPGLNGIAIRALLEVIPRELFKNIESVESHFSMYSDRRQWNFFTPYNSDLGLIELQNLFDRSILLEFDAIHKANWEFSQRLKEKNNTDQSH